LLSHSLASVGLGVLFNREESEDEQLGPGTSYSYSAAIFVLLIINPPLSAHQQPLCDIWDFGQSQARLPVCAGIAAIGPSSFHQLCPSGRLSPRPQTNINPVDLPVDI